MPFRVVRNDITRMCADAIVNTANPMPVIGAGADSAIYDAAGREELLAARRKIGEISRGQAAVTPAYDLNARYIIHTVGPVWKDGRQGEDIVLRSCYENCLRLAQEYSCRSIAFPLISTGTYGFPKELALAIVNDVVQDFLNSSDEDMMIYLVVFDRKAVRLSGKIWDGLDAYIDDRYADIQWKREHRSCRRREPRMLYEPREVYCETDLPEEYEYCSIGAAPVAQASSLDDLLNRPQETFQEMLLRLISESGMKNPEVYKKANLDKKLFSKIKSNPKYQPSKNTAIALALALNLNMDQTTDLLARAGYALSPVLDFDRVICYCLENEIYSVFLVEEYLFAHGLPALCYYE